MPAAKSFFFQKKIFNRWIWAEIGRWNLYNNHKPFIHLGFSKFELEV